MTEEEEIEEANVVFRKIEASIAEIVASEQKKKDGVLCLAFAEVAKTLLRLCLSALDEDGHEAFLSHILKYTAPQFTLTKGEVHDTRREHLVQ